MGDRRWGFPASPPNRRLVAHEMGSYKGAQEPLIARSRCAKAPHRGALARSVAIRRPDLFR